jgi:anthranilate synthase component II
MLAAPAVPSPAPAAVPSAAPATASAAAPSAAPAAMPSAAPAAVPSAAQRRAGGAHVLVIDNYDSFTYNLVQYLGELGARCTVWRNDAFDLGDVERAAPDAIVVSPGPCTPAEAGLSVALVERYSGRFPLLGVCLGHQAIGQAFGARVVRSPTIMHGKTSAVRHDGTGVFEGLPADVVATRYHSLIVVDPPATLVPNAWADDPSGAVIMGLRHAQHPTWGVQFHPESILTTTGHTMLRTFLGLVGP